jgi:hypothetical protein
MANGFRYHPSSRQRIPFERRSLWPQEEEERIPGSTYDPLLGGGSPINYEALGLPMDRRQREEEQFIRSMWGDPATSDYDIQVINREDLGLPPLGSRQPSIMPPMVTDFKTDVSLPPTLVDLVIDNIGERLRVPNAEKLRALGEQVSGVESKHGKRTRSTRSTARGKYQILKGTYKTALNRLGNILDRVYNVPKKDRNQQVMLPPRLKNTTWNDLDKGKISEADQEALFLAHMSESGMSDGMIYDYLEGKTSGKDLYQFHHYRGDPDPATIREMDEYLHSVY